MSTADKPSADDDLVSLSSSISSDSRSRAFSIDSNYDSDNSNKLDPLSNNRGMSAGWKRLPPTVSRTMDFSGAQADAPFGFYRNSNATIQQRAKTSHFTIGNRISQPDDRDDQSLMSESTIYSRPGSGKMRGQTSPALPSHHLLKPIIDSTSSRSSSSSLLSRFRDAKKPFPVVATSSTSPSKQDLKKFLLELDPLSLSLNIDQPTTFDVDIGNTSVLDIGISDGDDDESETENEESYELETSASSPTGGTIRRRRKKGLVADRNNISLDVDVDNSTTNEFIIRKKQRIRAEKLVDHSFMHRVLNKKASISDTQSIVNRIESILKLMDKDDTGKYII